MHTRLFPATEPRPVSEIGLGCWQLGSDWPAVDETTALAILRGAHDAGVTFFDTADIYGAGRSEELLGRFLRDLATREGKVSRPFIATKLGRSADPGWPENFTLPVMRRHVEGSLRRLGLETVDLLQLHCVPAEQLAAGDVFAHLRQLRDEGKIRSYGASVESMAEADLCLRDPELASLQIIFNVLRQTPIARLFATAQQRSIALIVRLPLASGLLAGKFTAATRFAADDHRNFNRDGQAFNVGETFAGLPFAIGLERIEELRAMLPENLSMARAAQRWILDHPAVTTVITGASRPEQAIENASVSDLDPLPADLHERWSIWYEQHVATHVRGPD